AATLKQQQSDWEISPFLPLHRRCRLNTVPDMSTEPRLFARVGARTPPLQFHTFTLRRLSGRWDGDEARRLSHTC
ncbi:uncharacterized, partial [Tachysurus ichikawai]